MNELNHFIDKVSASGGIVMNVSSVSRAAIEDGLCSLDNKCITGGQYVVLELRVLIPADA